MAPTSPSFRVGRVLAYLRGRIWYLCYHEDGRRRRPRVGPTKEAARQLAAQTNAQLEIGAPGILSFEPIAIPELRDRWLAYHEQVLRTSVATIRRYRAATEHLLRFVHRVRPVRSASQFHAHHAEEFVRYLRALRVASNGHPHSPKRPLLDNGIKYILETCRAMFSYALRRRHLSPYAENPFSVLQIDRIPVENARPIVLWTPEQERSFLEACDRWQFPIFFTLMLTGVRPFFKRSPSDHGSLGCYRMDPMRRNLSHFHRSTGAAIRGKGREVKKRTLGSSGRIFVIVNRIRRMSWGIMRVVGRHGAEIEKFFVGS